MLRGSGTCAVQVGGAGAGAVAGGRGTVHWGWRCHRGHEVQCAGSEGPCLRQQQRSRRGGEVRKMRLVRALITGTGSQRLLFTRLPFPV